MKKEVKKTIKKSAVETKTDIKQTIKPAKKVAPARARHEIDATDKIVGRVATQVVIILRGKNKPDFTPRIDGGDFVTILNAGQVKFTGKKLAQKDYRRHTMYPGGLKTTSMKKVFEADPTAVLRKAVYGMLPKNKLRGEMMKRLTIKA